MNFSILSKAFICLLLMMTVLAGCKKDDDTSECDAGTFTCKINGQVFTASSFNNTLFKGVDNNNGGAAAKRLDIRATAANGSQLVLSLSEFRDGKDGNNFRLGSYYFPDNIEEYGYCGNAQNGAYACAGGLVTYYPTSSLTNYVMTFPGSEDLDSTHNVTITANNEGALTISGTFKVTMEDLFGGGDDIVITDGEFNNVCYKVLEQ